MKSLIQYGNREIPYQIIRKSHLLKKVLIHVHPDATIEVEAPEEISLSDINMALLKRARWVCKQLDTVQEMKKSVLPREYVSGETHFYIGRRYQLKVIETDTRDQYVKLKSGRIEVKTRINDPIVIRRKMKLWYQKKAEEYFQKRLNAISQKILWLDYVPSFKLVNMQKQWGSCSPEGLIHLNPCLIRAPSECIDYVIVHEICHLKERNHSKKYYDLLHSHLSRWKTIKQRLDGMAELLLIE